MNSLVSVFKILFFSSSKFIQVKPKQNFIALRGKSGDSALPEGSVILLKRGEDMAKAVNFKTKMENRSLYDFYSDEQNAEEAY